MADFTLPELGENVTSGDVLKVLVKAGDTVTKDQTVLELETDKATIEVPSSVAGRVTAVAVKAGDKVKVGQVILSVEDGAQRQEGGGDKGAAATQEDAQEGAKQEDANAGRRRSRQKRSGKTRSRKRRNRPKRPRRRRPSTPTRPRCRKAGSISTSKGRSAPQQKTSRAGRKRPTRQRRPSRRSRTAGCRPIGRAPPPAGPRRTMSSPSAAGRARAPSRLAPETPPAPAAPSVRRMARELGVGIESVPGSGADGRISIEDVKAHAKRLIEGAGQARRPRGLRTSP